MNIYALVYMHWNLNVCIEKIECVIFFLEVMRFKQILTALDKLDFLYATRLSLAAF